MFLDLRYTMILLIFLNGCTTTVKNQPLKDPYQILLNENFFDGRDTLIDGLWLDISHDSFAAYIDYDNNKVSFYKQMNCKLHYKGSAKLGDRMGQIHFEDLDGDGVVEIMTNTSPNGNGNEWFNVYKYDNLNDSIVYAGDLTTDYTIDTLHGTIQVFHEGSWYTDVYKALYKWHGDSLILEKKIVKALKIKDQEHDDMFLDYYANSTHTRNGLKRVNHETWSDNNKKQNALWDNFFTQL